MCSELFRIPIEWAGVPIFGFGVLLLVWLTVGIAWLIWLGRRTHWSAETWSLLLPLLLGTAAILFLPKMFPDGLPIRGYGTMVLFGSVFGLWMATHRARQVGFDPEILMSLVFWMFLCGIAGARLFYVIEYWDSRFQYDSWSETLKEVLNFPQGGLVVYGSLIGAGMAFGTFCHRRRLPPLALADLIAPSLLAGLAIGRIGCLLNGCCYGGETDRPWAVTFPSGSVPYIDQVQSGRMVGFRLAENLGEDARLQIDWVRPNSPAAWSGLAAGDQIEKIGNYEVRTVEQAAEVLFTLFHARVPLDLLTSDGKTHNLPAVVIPSRSRPVHPTQLYSTINAGLLAWLLWSWYPLRRRDGEVTALMLTLYPIARFLLEMIRIDESAVFGTGLSISQNISLLVLAGAVGLWFALGRQQKLAIGLVPTREQRRVREQRRDKPGG